MSTMGDETQRSDWIAERPQPDPLDPFELDDLPSPSDLIDNNN